MRRQCARQSALDGFDPNANGAVRVVVVQPDGKILIGGDFTTLSPNGGVPVTRNHIARLNPDGTLDTAFNPNANGVVYAIAVQADGKILVGGFFNGANSIGGQTRNRIARLDATTGLADSFDPNANDRVHSIAVQADGKILAGGFFTTIGGQTRNRIARLDATTGLADSFNPNANGACRVNRGAGGRQDFSGRRFHTTASAEQTRNRIARLDATTGLADSFEPERELVVVCSIAVQADGKILAGGIFDEASADRRATASPGSIPRPAWLIRSTRTRTVLCPINRGAGGRQDFGGRHFQANSIGGQTRNLIARLDPTTGLADSFDPNRERHGVRSIAVQADGKILAGGDFTTSRRTAERQ